MNSIGYYKEVRIMKLEAKVNFDRFEEALQVVDAHTGMRRRNQDGYSIDCGCTRQGK